MPLGAAFVSQTGPFIPIEAFDWTIREFAKLEEPVLRSEVFEVLGDSWQLELYPNNVASDNSGRTLLTDSGDEIKCVGLFMAYKEENRLRVKALSYQVELVHSEEAKSIKKEDAFTFLSKWTRSTSGWQNFVPKNEVEGPLSGFLLDGALRIKMYFKISLSDVQLEPQNPLPLKMWKLYSEEVATDAEIQTEDGRVKAHKAVLMGMSTVICKLFIDQMQDQQPCLIDISDFPGRVAHAFIEYLYLQRLPIDVIEDDLVDLWALGDRYRVASLRHFVERVYGVVISPNDVLAVMVEEDERGARMKETCSNFFVERKLSSGTSSSS